MTFQSSISSPSSKEENLLEDIEDNVFGASEKSLLLKYLEKCASKLYCTCMECLQEEALHLGYQLARDLNKIYSIKWDEYKTLYPSTEYFKTNFMRNQLLTSSFVREKCRVNIEYRSKDHVLTTNDRQKLLRYIKLANKLYCRCVNCVKERVSYMVYQLAHELHRDYNIMWNTYGKADPVWVDNFAVQFKFGLRFKSPNKCKQFIEALTLKQNKPDILTFAQEIDLLKEVQIEGTRKRCKCITCSMEELEFKVYQSAKSSGTSYPSLWDKEKKADSIWMDSFEERHAIRIAEIFLNSHNCKNIVPRTPTCLTLPDERWLLLQINSSSKTRFDCKCRSCAMKEVTYLAYEFVHEYSKPYPGIWDIHQRTDSEWLERFKIRQDCIISNCDFAEECQGKEVLIQSVTSKPFTFVDISVTVFTLEEEKWLLLNELTKQELSCKCRSCAIEELPHLISRFSRDFMRSRPSLTTWDYELRMTGSKWLEEFVKRHYDIMSQFPYICTKTYASINFETV